MARKQIRKACQLKVTLKAIHPPVWRRVVVPGEFGLDELHWVIQLAMGWTNSHLRQFPFKTAEPPAPAVLRRMMMSGGFAALGGPAMRGERVFTDLSTVDGTDDGDDETRARLEHVAPKGRESSATTMISVTAGSTRCRSRITPMDPSATYSRCLAGKRCCPPEDCGGPWGYADLLDAVADPAHERHGELKEWLGDDFDPERFDVDAVNAALDEVSRD